ncbi:MAG TPA: pyridoxal-dependent decarboxylase [Actinomycetota bacterium]|nr:pyridoxal-dependent decarboxylase [Actinomycetota bacterium]
MDDLQPALDWVERYLATVPDLPVAARVQPGDVTAALPASPPATGEDIAAILADLDRILLPGVTHWNHPGFFGYFAITGSEPGIAGELISAALNLNGMLWRTSPALTELERVATRWLAQLLGLPQWFAVIHDTASSSTLTALAAARDRADPQARTRGLRNGGPPLAVYTSDQAHSSVDKAVLTLGLGTDLLRKIPSDDAFRMDPSALQARVAADRDDGIRPMAVVATIGTTATTSVDPVPAIAAVCQDHGAWLHVDAAYGGAAGAVPELRWVVEGTERADSIVVNPHKWLFVPVDCSVLYLRDPEVTRAAFSVVPDYLKTSEDAANLMDYGVALGRRFRALKLWMVLRSFGTERIAAILGEHVRLAKLLASWVEADPAFTLAAPVPLSVVNLRYTPAGSSPEEQDRLTAALVDRINARGRAYVTTAKIDGRTALHAAIGHLGHTEAGVLALWEQVAQAAAQLDGDGGGT